MRIRRRTLVYAAIGTVIAAGVVIAVAIGWALKTRSGQQYVRAQIEQRLAKAINGKVYVGRITGDLLSAPHIDSIEIRDADDSVLVATGRVTFKFTLGEAWRGVIALRDVNVEHPFIHIRRLASGKWNYKLAFKRDTSKKEPSGERKPGNPITIDGLTFRDGTFRWTEPWTPNSWLAGAARDSAVRATLARKDLNVKRAGSGFVRARDWTAMHADIPRLRVRHPDSAGVALQIERLDADEFDPPFKIRKARALVAIVNDSVRLDVSSFRLPGSHGSARGVIANKNGLSVAVRVEGDTVSLADVAWLYPTFPTEGGGRMTLDIRRARTSNITEFALTRLDVHTTKSRLRGAMTFGTGERLLRLTNVDVDLAPVDFKLFEQFAGAPLAMPWAGQLRGRVRGPGGPLDHFMIDSTAIDFADANVPGVTNRFSGKGEVDIVRTIETAFHDFAIDIQHFDLRTLQAVNPDFPPLRGAIAGTARLDSIWTDVRFRDLNLRYLVDTNTSRFTGTGRMTLGETAVIYDMDLAGGPLSLDALAETYPNLPARGSYTGPFSVRGSLANLGLTADVTGPAGRVRADLRIDGLAPGFGASGTVEFVDVDPARLLVSAPRADGKVNATFAIGVRGDSLANLDGAARATFTATTFRGVRFGNAYLALAFEDGLMRVDSVRVESHAFALDATGGIGLRADRRDSLRIVARADSLGGLRPWIAPLQIDVPADSLLGDITINARLTGSIDSLNTIATLQANNLVYGATVARALTIDADVADLLDKRVGRVTMTADGVVTAGLRFNSMTADAGLGAGNRARVIARLRAATGPAIDAGADVSWDSTTVRAVIDSLGLSVRENRWELARPATFAVSPGSFTLDTLHLRGNEGAALTFAATLPNSGAASAALQADAFPLSDLGALLQMPIPLSGRAALVAGLTGTRDAPAITFRVTAQETKVGETRIEGVEATGQYANRAMNIDASVRRASQRVLTARATVPMDLTLRSVDTRMLDAPLTGTITADSTDLAVIEAFSPGLTNATGKFDAHLTLGGTWREPRIDGLVSVARGAVTLSRLGVRYDDIQAQLLFFGDSVHINEISARSDGHARIFGHISVADWADPRFDLRFRTDRDFHVMNQRGVADVYLNTGTTNALRLAGRKSRSSLTSDGITVNGSVFVSEAISKRVVDLDDATLARLIDTTTLAGRNLLPAAPPAIVRNMQVEGVRILAGDNLRLRSEEANVKLTGELRMRVAARTLLEDANMRALTLEGTLAATEGTYRLNLGPVQRTFAVQSGQVRFFADPDIEPTIAIQATYDVRLDQREARPDVKINAAITGTLSHLRVAISSQDANISEDDAISYLLVGTPNLSLGGRTSDYTTMITRGLFTSVGAALTNSIGGGFFDEFTVSVAGRNDYSGGARSVGSSVLSGTRVGAGFRVNDRTTARLDAGLCQFGQLASGNSQGLDPVALADAMGGKIDVRVKTGLTLSFGIEPATSALMCAQNIRARGFVPTPRQFGLDLLKFWRF
ncbi:MAG TPA: translocation/assembly module TamB domain-containing protein [Gemmatimonadaceae bacterium]|nr:translocation/assembly module TamB domain-containing protein [Gemmatimonadaceae bacterium]